MSDIITEHNLFKPKPIKQSKADITNHAARAIIGDEAARRDAKTARLRKARLIAETLLATAPSPTKTISRKSKAARRARSSM